MALWLFLSVVLMQGPLPRLESGTVTGVVRLPDGKPAAGVRVAAMVPPVPGLTPGNASELAAIGKTDESGRFRLEDVPVGRYYIVAGRVDAPTYYPGVPGTTGATVLSVTGGAALAGIDFVISDQSVRMPDRPDSLQQYLSSLFLVNNPMVPVTGRIVLDENSAGAKLPASVTLNARNDSIPKYATNGTRVIANSGNSTRASVSPDGSFAVTLPSGESAISIQGLPEGYTVKSITSGSTNLLARPVNVQAGMAEIVIVVTADLRPRFTVAGRVMSGTTSRNIMGEQIELLGDSGAIVRLILDAQGGFVFRRLLPGNYILRVTSGLGVPEPRIAVTDHDITDLELETRE